MQHHNQLRMQHNEKVLINHVMDLDRKIGSTKFNLDQLNVGRGAFMNALKETLKPDPEPQEQQQDQAA
jgi:hypothetical protein